MVDADDCLFDETALRTVEDSGRQIFKGFGGRRRLIVGGRFPAISLREMVANQALQLIAVAILEQLSLFLFAEALKPWVEGVWFLNVDFVVAVGDVCC